MDRMKQVLIVSVDILLVVELLARAATHRVPTWNYIFGYFAVTDHTFIAFSTLPGMSNLESNERCPRGRTYCVSGGGGSTEEMGGWRARVAVELSYTKIAAAASAGNGGILILELVTVPGEARRMATAGSQGGEGDVDDSGGACNFGIPFTHNPKLRRIRHYALLRPTPKRCGAGQRVLISPRTERASNVIDKMVSLLVCPYIHLVGFVIPPVETTILRGHARCVAFGDRGTHA